MKGKEKGMGLKLLAWLLALAGVAALTGFALLTAVCVSAGTEWKAEPADCIVVLGAHVWNDGRMSNSLRHRCEAALAAWQEGLAPAIIVCGGQGPDEPGPEADYMAAWMQLHGLPDEALFVDNTSLDTTQNMLNAKAIMAANGMSTAAICTSDYHLRRALWVARDHGLTTTGGVPSPSPTDAKSLIVSRFRETCSWILYFLRVP